MARLGNLRKSSVQISHFLHFKNFKKMGNALFFVSLILVFGLVMKIAANIISRLLSLLQFAAFILALIGLVAMARDPETLAEVLNGLKILLDLLANE
jgi:hypothetical protein